MVPARAGGVELLTEFAEPAVENVKAYVPALALSIAAVPLNTTLTENDCRSAAAKLPKVTKPPLNTVGAAVRVVAFERSSSVRASASSLNTVEFTCRLFVAPITRPKLLSEVRRSRASAPDVVTVPAAIWTDRAVAEPKFAKAGVAATFMLVIALIDEATAATALALVTTACAGVLSNVTPPMVIVPLSEIDVPEAVKPVALSKPTPLIEKPPTEPKLVETGLQLASTRVSAENATAQPIVTLCVDELKVVAARVAVPEPLNVENWIGTTSFAVTVPDANLAPVTLIVAVNVEANGPDRRVIKPTGPSWSVVAGVAGKAWVDIRRAVVETTALLKVPEFNV